MPKKVMVCDDAKLAALAIKQFLIGASYDVTSLTYSVAEFTAALEEVEKPDFVTMDYVLPDGDGVDCCKALWAKWDGMPVLFITADPVPDDRKSELPHVKHFMLKPIASDKMQAAIDQL